MKRAAILPILILSMCLSGCNAYGTASNTASVIGQIIALAQADLPALVTAGVISSSDQTTIQGFLTLGSTLQTQLTSCVNGAHLAGNKKSAFAACFTAFSSGLLSSTELAQLRILSPSAQAKVQLWVTAIVLAVNAVLALTGSTSVAQPAIASTPATSTDLRAFGNRLNLAYGY